MHLKNIFLCVLVLIGLSLGCESKDGPRSATLDSSLQAEPEKEQEAPRKLQPPPGEPGPVMIRLADSFPTQIFGASATETKIALAMQSDARDVSLCPETELLVCFRGLGVITDRLNPNEPKTVHLYESDTQSGTRIDSVLGVKDRFLFAVNEGIYVGDARRCEVTVVNEQAQIERKVDLSSPDISINQILLRPWTEERALVCVSFEPEQGKPGIRCEALDAVSGTRSTVATVSSSSPVRTFDMAVSGEHALVVWVESGHAKVCFLDNPNEIVDLGLATATPVHVAAGLNDFAVVWQGDDGQTRVDRVPISNAIKGLQRETIVLNGLDYRTISGLIAISEGYLFGFRHQNTQQMALVASDFKGWHLIENNQVWRMMSGYASLDIQEAHTGKIVWQTAESLIGIK